MIQADRRVGREVHVPLFGHHALSGADQNPVSGDGNKFLTHDSTAPPVCGRAPAELRPIQRPPVGCARTPGKAAPPARFADKPRLPAVFPSSFEDETSWLR